MTETLLDKLDSLSAARINWFLGKKGYKYVKWDTEEIQARLIESYIPFTSIPVAAMDLSHLEPKIRIAFLKVRLSLEEQGFPYYPEMTAQYRKAETLIKLIITLDRRGTPNRYFVPMLHKDKRRFKKACKAFLSMD